MIYLVMTESCFLGIGAVITSGAGCVIIPATFGAGGSLAQVIYFVMAENCLF